jgi:hypothetical protein
VNQSNYVSSTSTTINNRITNLHLDEIANGSLNRYIIDNVYNANLTVTGTLNASNLNITGQTTYITTNTYQTENLEITTSANDGVPALNVTQSGGLNVAEFYDTNSNVLIVKKGGNVGIGTTDPLERLHVIGNIRFSQSVNGITSNELATLTGINGNVQTQFTSTSNYVLSTSNFLANAATTASNNIINIINTYYDVNQSNYVVSTSNVLQGQINNKQDKINVAANYLVGTGSIPDSLQQIQVSTGLSLTGGVLTATGGGGADSRWTTINTNDIYLTNTAGKIGIGTNNPREELHLHNSTTIQNVFTQYSDGTTTGVANRGCILGKTSLQNFGFSNMEIGKDFVFYTTPTAQGVIAERMRILANGNVGIGITNPQEELHMHKTTAVDARVRFTNSATGSASTDGSCVGVDASGNLEVRNVENLPIILYTNNTERIRILSGGNVGIGTTNPSTYKLHLEDGSLFVGDIANTGSTTTDTANGYRLVFDNTYNGTVGSGTIANKIMIFNNVTSAYGFGIESSALVYQSGSAHNFYTGTTNSAYGTLRMFLSSGGDLNVTGNITAYYSDQRLKNITSNITNSLEIIDNLKGFYYTPNELAHKFAINHTKQEIGISAQDVQKVLPELVTIAPFDVAKDNDNNIISKSGENYLTIAYERLAPVFIEAIKELHNEIKLLKEENKIIKDKLNSL